MQFCQIILIGLLISFVNTQQQPAKFHTNILRHASPCKEKVSSDSSIQLRYTAKLLDTNEIIENKTLDLKPGIPPPLIISLATFLTDMCFP
ncbi:hypothetical protein INT47_011632 [Mucor saturninus]|uniref:Uncharacterized protein n=1 Tax=Mucor saturninus TaxID=64648 RepID=A0A8H7R426_9FUNG|nr:hypothetical protein INT47_011632 [Mucor saturninus]